MVNDITINLILNLLIFIGILKPKSVVHLVVQWPEPAGVEAEPSIVVKIKVKGANSFTDILSPTLTSHIKY